MCYTISLIINLKNKNNGTELENLIKDSSINCNSSSNYSDFNLEGTNNYVKTNDKIIILEFEEMNNILNFIEFIRTIKDIKIEYIYNNNNILFATKKYLKNLDRNLHNKIELIDTINKNKLNNKYKKIYDLIEKKK